MKKLEQNLAKDLRKKGLSMNEIAKKLKVAKSSVSLWVGDIELTDKQVKGLSKKGHSKKVVEKRRQTRIRNEKVYRSKLIEGGKREISKISKKNLFFIGVSLYWAEGRKAGRGSIEFSNGDPRLIEIMKVFFKEICNVPDYKFRGRISLHPHLNTKIAEAYWSKISNVPRSQFQKTVRQHNKASKNKKDSLPYGTFNLCVYDTKLFLRMEGWREGISEKLKC